MIDPSEHPWMMALDEWITIHPDGPTGWVPSWHPRRVATRQLQRELRRQEYDRQDHDSGVSPGDDHYDGARVRESDETPQR